MGAIDDKAQDERDERRAKGKNAKRGSVDNKGRLAGLKQGGSIKGDATWMNADAEALLSVVDIATRRGAMVTFSLSRDGGAYGLALYMDGERVQLWFNGDADLYAELAKVHTYFADM